MFSFTISLIAILLAAVLIAVVTYYFNPSTEDAESDIAAAALITQGEQILAAIDVRALDTQADLRQVDHLVTNKYLSSVPTPAKGTYMADVGLASPEDWRVLTRGMKPPILLHEKVNEATCLLVNSKSGYAGIMSGADPTRRIQCFGKSEPYSVLLNPTAKDWQRCEKDPLLPECTTQPPRPYCEVNPGAPECQKCVLEPHHSWCKPPKFCELYPKDPSCEPPKEFCDLYPLDPSCQPVNCKTQPTLPECKPFCERFPAHPDCLIIDNWCEINPDLEQCKPFCKRFPEHPDCLVIDNWCEINPDLCKSYCEKYPEDPLCDKIFCEKYPDHPSCKPPRDFCDEFPTHELCVDGPGPGGPICEVVTGTVPCEFDASGSCTHDGYRYSTVGGVTYKCPDKPKECKITSTLLSPGSGYWLRYHIYRFAAQAGSAGGTAGYVTKHASWEDAYRPAPTGREWVKYVAIDPVYEVTNSCTGKCTLVDLELPVHPELGTPICAEWGGSGTCTKVTAEGEAYQAAMAVYHSKLAEFRANKSRYTLIGGKYYDCGGGGPICTP